MKRPFIKSVLAALAVVGASAAVTAPVSAAPAAASAGLSTEVAVTQSQQDHVDAYWTEQRMESATPGEKRLKDKEPKHHRPGHGKGKGKSGKAVQETPQPELGKVFFTLDGTNYVCSGTATNSANESVVTTAGHCLHEGPGDFATNFAFVPAYEDGDRPYGTWTARSLHTTTQWGNSGDFEYDAGFAVMNTNDNDQTLTEVVGSYPIGFNLSRGLDYKSYGYPAGTPFDGQSLWSCTGTASDDPFGASTQGVACDMTGGSSGGGWITDSGNGVLNSVNSYKYTFDSKTMYGPYFGSTIQSVYNTASQN